MGSSHPSYRGDCFGPNYQPPACGFSASRLAFAMYGRLCVENHSDGFSCPSLRYQSWQQGQYVRNRLIVNNMTSGMHFA